MEWSHWGLRCGKCGLSVLTWWSHCVPPWLCLYWLKEQLSLVPPESLPLEGAVHIFKTAKKSKTEPIALSNMIMNVPIVRLRRKEITKYVTNPYLWKNCQVEVSNLIYFIHLKIKNSSWMLLIVNYLRNANQNFNEVPPQTGQNGHQLKLFK